MKDVKNITHKFYKKDKTIFALIYSDKDAQVLLSFNEGRILKGPKKVLKEKGYTKSKKGFEINEEMKYKIIDTLTKFKADKAGIIEYTEDYLSQEEFKDRQEYFQNLSDEEYKKSLDELKD